MMLKRHYILLLVCCVIQVILLFVFIAINDVAFTILISFVFFFFVFNGVLAR